MSKQLVDQGGMLVLGTAADPDSLFGGTQLKNASLTLTTQTASAQAIGEGCKEEAVASRSWEMTATRYYSAGDAVGFFGAGDTCHATYSTQSTTAQGVFDTILFEGPVVVTRAHDGQSVGEFETQEITVRSTGAPTKPPYGGA